VRVWNIKNFIFYNLKKRKKIISNIYEKLKELKIKLCEELEKSDLFYHWAFIDEHKINVSNLSNQSGQSIYLLIYYCYELWKKNFFFHFVLFVILLEIYSKMWKKSKNLIENNLNIDAKLKNEIDFIEKKKKRVKKHVIIYKFI